MIEIIPAIDIRGGRFVRLFRGDYAAETVYGDDPVAMAQRFEKAGARRLHVVDLDGARDGLPANFELVAGIAQTLAIPVQMGGGLRTTAAVEQMLQAGVARCIIGTRAVREPEWAQQLFARFGDRMVLGLDAREGMVSVAGWREDSRIPVLDFARSMEQAGCPRIIYTDISRDGTLTGPNLAWLRALTEAVDVPVIASGGVHGVDDISALSVIPGVEGAIVGKALYVGSTSLESLLEAATTYAR